MSLFDSLSKISGEIKKQRNLIKKESAIKQVSVQPFIKALGYNTNNLAEVEEEFDADAADSGGERVDYAIKLAGEPIILIEAKQANAILSEKFWKQLHHYVGATDARFGVLTNGIEYLFYTDLKKNNVMDKDPFLVIDMLNLDERLVAELEWFTKSSFDPDRIKAGARKQVILGLLQQEMDRPSDALVKHFAGQVHSGRLSASDNQRYARLLRETWRELSEHVHAKPGELTEKLPVFADYQGRQFKATLMIDDRMWLQRVDNMLFDGKPMNHAVAAFEAVKKVDPLMKKWPTGWIFWHFIDSDTGEERPIKDIFEDVWTRNSSNGY